MQLTDRFNAHLVSTILLLIAPVLFFAIWILQPLQGLSSSGHAVLGSVLWMAMWWVGEVVPLAITALLPFVLYPLTGVQDMKTTGAALGDPIILLFLGGFMMAMAIEKYHLHQRVALWLIKRIGVNPKQLVLGFMIAAALLSMWISNSATAIMMVPIAIAVSREINQIVDQPSAEKIIFTKALLLGTAYACSIGGIATLIGTPTNVILVGMVDRLYETTISFAQWMIFATPLAIVMLLICWWYLVKFAMPLNIHYPKSALINLQRKFDEMGSLSKDQSGVVIVFLMVVVAWLFRTVFLNQWIPQLNDAMIALIGAISLFLIPQENGKGALLDWQSAVKLPWDIILLFGGGLALAAGTISSGLADWLGSQLEALGQVPLWLLLLLIIGLINFTTEITSNTAMASIVLPILASLSNAIEVNPYLLMIGASIGASCAFMLPIATPPNVIVYSAQVLDIKDMIRAGFWMNVISILMISAYLYCFASWLPI